MASVGSCPVSFDVFASNVVLALLNVASGIIAICSNLLILVAFYQTASLRSISNFFVVSLAASDLLVGLAVNPVYVVLFVTGLSFDYSHVWPARLAENWLWIQTVITSTFNLTAISVDRYIAITNTFQYSQIVTPTRCVVGAIFIWTFSILFASVRFLIHDFSDLPILWIIIMILTVVLPLCVICYCYFHIFRAARLQQRQIAVLSSVNAAYANTVLKNKKAAWTIGIIIGLFVLMWTPNLVLAFVEIVTARKGSCRRLEIVLSWYFASFLSFFSSCCNPWVYASRSREFRAAFKRVLKFRRIDHITPGGATISFRSSRSPTLQILRGWFISVCFNEELSSKLTISKIVLAAWFLLCNSHQHQRFKNSYLCKANELVNKLCIHLDFVLNKWLFTLVSMSLYISLRVRVR